MAKKQTIKVESFEIVLYSQNSEDYISLTFPKKLRRCRPLLSMPAKQICSMSHCLEKQQYNGAKKILVLMVMCEMRPLWSNW